MLPSPVHIPGTFDALRTRPYAPTVAETSPARGRWTIRHVPPTPRSIVELIRAGTLDAELAALLWVLIEGRVPLIVAAAAPGAGKTTLLDALLGIPAARRPHRRTGRGRPRRSTGCPRRPSSGGAGRRRPPTVTTIRRSGPTTQSCSSQSCPTTCRRTRGAPRPGIAIRAVAIGYGLAATIHADSLDEVFEQLRRPPVGLVDDELSRLGVVLILRPVGDGRRRVVAAHYIRPVARDEHGHVQRLGPAVLATWAPDHDRFEHFAWGITPELALRVDRRPGDFEIEVDRRRDYLAGLAEAGIVEVEAVRAAIDGYRSTITDPTSIPATN